MRAARAAAVLRPYLSPSSRGSASRSRGQSTTAGRRELAHPASTRYGVLMRDCRTVLLLLLRDYRAAGAATKAVDADCSPFYRQRPHPSCETDRTSVACESVVPGHGPRKLPLTGHPACGRDLCHGLERE
jgi:hypothetical protein